MDANSITVKPDGTVNPIILPDGNVGTNTPPSAAEHTRPAIVPPQNRTQNLGKGRAVDAAGRQYQITKPANPDKAKAADGKPQTTVAEHDRPVQLQPDRKAIVVPKKSGTPVGNRVATPILDAKSQVAKSDIPIGTRVATPVDIPHPIEQAARKIKAAQKEFETALAGNDPRRAYVASRNLERAIEKGLAESARKHSTPDSQLMSKRDDLGKQIKLAKSSLENISPEGRKLLTVADLNRAQRKIEIAQQKFQKIYGDGEATSLQRSQAQSELQRAIGKARPLALDIGRRYPELKSSVISLQARANSAESMVHQLSRSDNLTIATTRPSEPTLITRPLNDGERAELTDLRKRFNITGPAPKGAIEEQQQLRDLRKFASLDGGQKGQTGTAVAQGDQPRRIANIHRVATPIDEDTAVKLRELKAMPGRIQDLRERLAFAHGRGDVRLIDTLKSRLDMEMKNGERAITAVGSQADGHDINNIRAEIRASNTVIDKVTKDPIIVAKQNLARAEQATKLRTEMAQEDLNAAKERFGGDHPDVKAAEAKLASTKTTGENAVRTARVELRLAEERRLAEQAKSGDRMAIAKHRLVQAQREVAHNIDGAKARLDVAQQRQAQEPSISNRVSAALARRNFAAQHGRGIARLAQAQEGLARAQQAQTAPQQAVTAPQTRTVLSVKTSGKQTLATAAVGGVVAGATKAVQTYSQKRTEGKSRLAAAGEAALEGGKETIVTSGKGTVLGLVTGVGAKKVGELAANELAKRAPGILGTTGGQVVRGVAGNVAPIVSATIAAKQIVDIAEDPTLTRDQKDVKELRTASKTVGATAGVGVAGFGAGILVGAGIVSNPVGWAIGVAGAITLGIAGTSAGDSIGTSLFGEKPQMLVSEQDDQSIRESVAPRMPRFINIPTVKRR